MSNIDAEIEAIEEMIELQRRKIDLLRAKSRELYDNDQRNNKNSSPIGSMDGEVEQDSSNPMIAMRDSNSGNAKQIKRDIKAFERNIPDMINEPKSCDSSVVSSPTPASKAVSKPKPESDASKTDKGIDALTRFSRLSTDLANERTLLAWVRTGLATARTVVSFMGLSTLSQFGDVAQKICYIGFSVLAVAMMAQGAERYKRIKWILDMPNPTREFGRLTTAPILVTLVLLLILVLVASSDSAWN